MAAKDERAYEAALASADPLAWLRWSAGALSWGKSFRDNPILGSPALNRAGLHVGRLIAADAAVRARRAQLAPLVPRSWRQAFSRDGFLLVRDFLGEAAHRAVQSEARAQGGTMRECVQGDTLTYCVLLDRARRAAMPATTALIEDRCLCRMLAWASGSTWPPIFYVQQILNGVRDAAPDPQKHLHSDTFHSTIKAWYFLDDVPLDGGPFRYVPGSHRLTLARLRWEHARSIDVVRDGDSYSARGSLRLDEEDRVALGYPPAQSFDVPANTLVVADTHGFHARGHAPRPCSRLEIWAYLRPHPFRPFAVVPVPFASALQDAAIRYWWHREDARAAKVGHVAPWHPIERASFEPLANAAD
jgi:hypothetical protein